MGGTPSQGLGRCLTHHGSSVTAVCPPPHFSLVKIKFLSGPRSFPESGIRETIPGNRGGVIQHNLIENLVSLHPPVPSSSHVVLMRCKELPLKEVQLIK